jgi:hypothetical protein
MPSSNPVDYGADPCGLRNSAWAINECLFAALRCDFPVGTFLLGSSPGAKIIDRVRTAGVATFNTSTPHGLVVGEKITLYGFTDGTFNGTGPLQFGFTVLSIPTPTQFTAAVPGADAPLVTEDGWINLIGGGYTSSLVMGYPPFTGVINNIAFTGQGIGKTTLKFADHTSTKRGDTFGFNIQMLKTLGNYTGFGVVGAPGSYAGAPLDSINCKNTIIEGITFDGNYANNSVADIKIISIQRTNGVNTYNTAYPHFITPTATPAYTPPVVPAPYTNVSAVNQYISNVITVGPGNDLSFVGFGQVENITSMSFQRDLRVVLTQGRINQFGYAIYTKHPQWNFGFTTGDTITVTGYSNAALNGTFVVAGFISAQEAFCLNVGTPTIFSMIGYERLTNVATYDTSLVHTFIPGDTVFISGFANPTLNGTFVITGIPSPTQFSCANAGPDTGVIGDSGLVYEVINENARAWAYPDVALTAQSTAGVNSSFTVAGINHVGENALIQNNQFYDFGVGIADAETFIVKSFLPMNVPDNTQGARVLNNDFSYQGRNSIQSTLYPGSAESNTQCVVGGFSSLIDPINVVSRVGGVATYTCVMKHTLRVGDVVIVNSFSNPTFNGSLTVISTPDAFRFTANTGGPDVLPGLYLDGQVIMLRSQRIFATGCEFKYNRVQGGPNPVDQQSPVTAITVREANGADISYNNFDGFRGTCFYVDSYQHKGTHIHHNSALNISAFIALVVQDWFTLISGVPSVTNPEAYSTLISGHKDMLIENNDVLLTGPGSWFYQTAYLPLDAVFLVNNHDVNKSTWYYPTDYQIPIRPLAPPAPFPTGASRDAAGISTFTTVSPHELQVGMEISMVSVADGTFNGVFTVLSTPSTTQFTVNNPVGPLPNTPVTSGSGFLGINSPINFPWEIKPIGFQRTAGVATYTTNKAHQILLGYHVTVEGLSNASFNDQVIVTGTPTTTTFTCASPGPDVAFTSSIGNFFRYVDNIQIGCNSVRRLSGQGLVRNNGGQFGNAFLTGRPNRCVAPLEQFFYFDCPEGCLALECDPGPCKPNDYLYRI